MTPAERQRRRRLGLTSRPVTKPPDVTKQPDVTISTPDVTKPASGQKLTQPLLSRKEIEQWARDLDIEDRDMDKLVKLIWERDLQLWLVDPKETARAFLRQLGYGGCLDVYEALGEVMDEDDDANT